MPADRDWARISDLFERALDLPASARSSFLDNACGGDRRIRAELDALLAAHERAGTPIDHALPVTAASMTSLAPAVGAAASDVPIGQQVGHYRIDRVLGEGGMGVVYLATDTRLGRPVALKAIAARFTGDPARRERLRREARAAAALSHPGIATVYALEDIEGSLYIASEHVAGATLREELAAGPLTVDRVLDVALQVAHALAAAHDRGVVHRDLKPENVMRATGGDVKIVDFGLARFRDDASGGAPLTQSGTLLGTPAYMAPEQIRGEATDGRTDLFALGVLIYEMTTGVRPFRGLDAASTIARVLEADPGPMYEACASGDRRRPDLLALSDIVRVCLQKAPDARYRSAHEIVRALERARSATRASATALQATPAPEGDATRHPLWWWQFHQAAASGVHIALLVPLWIACAWIDNAWSQTLFLAGLAAVVAATALRLHVRFVVRSYPAEWPRQRARTAGWIRLADVVVVLVLLLASGLMLASHFAMAAVLFGAAVGVLMSFAVIEPATTRAAFGG